MGPSTPGAYLQSYKGGPAGWRDWHGGGEARSWDDNALLASWWVAHANCTHLCGRAAACCAHAVACHVLPMKVRTPPPWHLLRRGRPARKAQGLGAPPCQHCNRAGSPILTCPTLPPCSPAHEFARPRGPPADVKARRGEAALHRLAQPRVLLLHAVTGRQAVRHECLVGSQAGLQVIVKEHLLSQREAWGATTQGCQRAGCEGTDERRAWRQTQGRPARHVQGTALALQRPGARGITVLTSSQGPYLRSRAGPQLRLAADCQQNLWHALLALPALTKGTEMGACTCAKHPGLLAPFFPCLLTKRLG